MSSPAFIKLKKTDMSVGGMLFSKYETYNEVVATPWLALFHRTYPDVGGAKIELMSAK
jgi:hypothetical protein